MEALTLHSNVTISFSVETSEVSTDIVPFVKGTNVAEVLSRIFTEPPTFPRVQLLM